LGQKSPKDLLKKKKRKQGLGFAKSAIFIEKGECSFQK
jgi:hypothetical protein